VSAAPIVEQASPRALPKPGFLVAALLTVVGSVTFLVGLATDPQTAWRAFHVNYLYFGTMAQGALVIACSFVIIGARWPGPVRRIAESLAAWVPVTLVLSVIGIAGRHYVYPWIDAPLPAKAVWLNAPRMYATDIGILFVLTILTVSFLKASLRPTLKAAEADATGFAKSMIARWTADWQGEEAEAEASARRLGVLAPLICLLFAFGYSLICFDQVMSLEPTWFSNLFGAYFAWGGFLGGLSLTAVLCVLHRSYAGLEGEITTARLHDLGKLIFGFSIFWMYLFFSQYIVIWYGNLPEETGFLRDRLGTEFLMNTWYWQGWWSRIWDEPWVKVSLFAWLCIFVIPFWGLLGAKPKKTPWMLACLASISVFGLWVERNVLVWPSLAPQDTWAFLGPIQIGTALGFAGAYAMTVMIYLRVFPSLPIPRR